MKIYLDDDSAAELLAKLLRKAGHDVQTPNEAGTSGAHDPVHLTHAIRAGRVLITKNFHDFKRLHELVESAGGSHPGILTVRKDYDKRDMGEGGVSRSILNFEALSEPATGAFIILNLYR